ncbi:flocculation protein FLO11 isoform X1 [Drosophila sechellia]|uniref:GM16303 n=1 Tax=Drosophila sechellia TaxID=7238 RepID=B4IGY9_DROSE|nr:flocculation protein FLO11 isoform X1 [Drosophila sechellia]EDW49107.1 GM16303 [Drosophila sechellia]
MKKFCLLLLMAHFVSSSRNLNDILGREEWISIAKEYIKNHKPYKAKIYVPYKPRIVNFTNPFDGDFWDTTTVATNAESTTNPQETTDYFTGEALTTTEKYATEESTTSAADYSTTESSYVTSSTDTLYSTTTAWPEVNSTEAIDATESVAVYSTKTSSPDDATEDSTTETNPDSTEYAESTLIYPDLTTGWLETTTETIQSSTGLQESTTTETIPSTTGWPESTTTLSSEFSEKELMKTTTEIEIKPSTTELPESTTESADSTTEPNESTFALSTDQTTTETAETSTEGLFSTTEAQEYTTSLLEIIATTPGVETTTSYLDGVIDSAKEESSTLSTPFGFNLTTTEIVETQVETTTQRQLNFVEDYVRQRPRKLKYSSDTEPELYWY